MGSGMHNVISPSAADHTWKRENEQRERKRERERERERERKKERKKESPMMHSRHAIS